MSDYDLFKDIPDFSKWTKIEPVQLQVITSLGASSTKEKFKGKSWIIAIAKSTFLVEIRKSVLCLQMLRKHLVVIMDLRHIYLHGTKNQQNEYIF